MRLERLEAVTEKLRDWENRLTKILEITENHTKTQIDNIMEALRELEAIKDELEKSRAARGRNGSRGRNAKPNADELVRSLESELEKVLKNAQEINVRVILDLDDVESHSTFCLTCQGLIFPQNDYFRSWNVLHTRVVEGLDDLRASDHGKHHSDLAKIYEAILKKLETIKDSSADRQELGELQRDFDKDRAILRSASQAYQQRACSLRWE